MDIELEGILSPLREDVSLAESTYSEGSIGTPVLQRESLEQLFQKKHRNSKSGDLTSKKRESHIHDEARTVGPCSKTGSGRCPSITEESSFPKEEKMEGRAEEVPPTDKFVPMPSGGSSTQRDVTPQGITKRKRSSNVPAAGTRPRRPFPDDRSSGSPDRRRSLLCVSEVKVSEVSNRSRDAKGSEANNSMKIEERRKSKNRSLESEIRSLKNQMASMEESMKSFRLGVMMELDSHSNFLLDVQSQLHRKFNKILEESQKTNEHLLSTIEKQNEMNHKLLCALLARSRLT